MIKIFSKIRKQLISEKPSLSRTSNYLKYAIGEIVLVMVGILLALQVNTWNEQRKLASEEQYLLKELLTEFNNNLQLIKNDQKVNKNNQNAAINLLDLIDQKFNQSNNNIIDSLFMSVFSYSSFNATTGALDEIISSGKLKAIKNNELRNMLRQWYGIIENQQEDIDIRRDQLNFHVEPFFVKYIPFKNGDQYLNFKHWSKQYKRKKLKKSNFSYNLKAFASREFEGMLYKYVLDQDFVLLNDLETEKFIQEVINQIKKNIKTI